MPASVLRLFSASISQLQSPDSFSYSPLLQHGISRLLLTTSYYQLSVQNWFSLHRLQLLYNHSVQATFNATGIHAPASYSFHCEHVSSLQRYDALLVPSSANDLSQLWEVTFIDFQVMPWI